MKSTTGTVVSIIVAVTLVLVAAWLVSNTGPGAEQAGGANVFVENGTQIVDIAARGGYLPRNSIAKSGVPTIIRVATKSTFDCSAALNVPAANFQQVLPASGTTDIPLVAQEPGAVVRGVCGMGMYSFEVVFE